jgi:hypothetical protein
MLAITIGGSDIKVVVVPEYICAWVCRIIIDRINRDRGPMALYLESWLRAPRLPPLPLYRPMAPSLKHFIMAVTCLRPMNLS